MKRKEGRKENQFGGGGEHNRKEKEKREKKEKEKKGKEDEEKGRRTVFSPSTFRRSTDQGVGIVHAPRARGFFYSIYSMLKGHSMAIGFDPNHRVGS